jgi:hypothetical protein
MIDFFINNIITIGGLLLIIGALFMFLGKVYYSSWTYVFADLCWSTNSFIHGDILGTVMVNTGLILGIGAMYKMHIGLFTKDLKN